MSRLVCCASATVAPEPQRASQSSSEAGGTSVNGRWMIDDFGQRVPIHHSITDTMDRIFDDISRESADLDSGAIAFWQPLLNSCTPNRAPAEAIHLCREADPAAFSAACLHGLPASLRGDIWLHASGAAELIAQTAAVFTSTSSSAESINNFASNDSFSTSAGERFYSSLCARAYSNPGPCARQISVDVPRTLPNHPYFEADNPEFSARPALSRVLNCVALEEPDVGYMQGMNMLASLFLLVFGPDAEYKAFFLMMAFLRNYHMADYYREGLIRLNQSMSDTGALLRTFLPELWSHMEREGVLPMCYVTPWLITVFAYNCSDLNIAARILDMFFLLHPGDETVFRVGLVYLQSREPKFMKATFSDMVFETKDLHFDDVVDEKGKLIKRRDDLQDGDNDMDSRLRTAPKINPAVLQRNLDKLLRAAHSLPFQELARKSGIEFERKRFPNAPKPPMLPTSLFTPVSSTLPSSSSLVSSSASSPSDSASSTAFPFSVSPVSSKESSETSNSKDELVNIHAPSFMSGDENNNVLVIPPADEENSLNRPQHRPAPLLIPNADDSDQRI